MAKRKTKADVILAEARERLDDAYGALRDAEASVRAASAVVAANKAAYESLEKALTPKPRNKVTPKPPPAQKDLPVDKPAICGACGNTEDYQDHFEPSPHYHKFEPPKPVASVTRRSSRKGAGTGSIPSTAEETASVLNVSNGGD